MGIVAKCPKCGKLVPTRPATANEKNDIINANLRNSIDSQSVQKKMGKGGFLGGIAKVADAVGNAAAAVGSSAAAAVGSVITGEVIECTCGFIGTVDLVGEKDYSGDYIAAVANKFDKYASPEERYAALKRIMKLRDNPSVRNIHKQMLEKSFATVSKETAKLDPVLRKFIIIPISFNPKSKRVFQMANDIVPSGLSFESGMVVIPEKETLYVQHPLNPNRYLPFKGFDTAITREQTSQMLLLLQSLGAKEVTIEFKIDRSTQDATRTFMSQALEVGTMPAASGTSVTNSSSQESGDNQSTSLKYKQVFGMPKQLPKLPDTKLPWYESPACEDWRYKAQQRLGNNRNLLTDTFSLHLELSSYVNTAEKTAVAEDVRYMVTSAALKSEYSSEAMHKECMSHQVSVHVQYYSVDEIKRAIAPPKPQPAPAKVEAPKASTIAPHTPEEPKKKGLFGKLFN